jgi:prevent-host-death family protein
MQSIGIRELRQAASEHLRAVAAGETFVVTDRGVPVARLSPVSPLERHLAEQIVAHSLVPPVRERRRFASAPRLSGAGLSGLVEDARADRDPLPG